MKRRPPIYLRARTLIDPASGELVGALVPAYAEDQATLRARAFTNGELVRGELARPRNPGLHRLAHRFGGLVSENIAGFEGLDYHAVLKRLQRESGAGCERIEIPLPAGLGMWGYNEPHSMAYDSMDDSEFRELIAALCRHVAATYWPKCEPEQIEDMAQAMVTEA